MQPTQQWDVCSILSRPVRISANGDPTVLASALLRKNKKRPKAPLAFVREPSIAEIGRAMCEPDSDVPIEVLPEAVYQLIVNPQRVLDLPKTNDTKRMVTASFFEADSLRFVGLLELEAHRLPGGITLDALAFEYFPISIPTSPGADVLCLAERVEQFVREARHFPSSYSWPHPRIRRGLWLGGVEDDDIRALGAAAGIALRVSPAETPSVKRVEVSFAAFDSEPEIVLCWTEQLSADQSKIIEEAVRRSITIVPLCGDRAPAIADARLALHKSVFASLPPPPPAVQPPLTPTEKKRFKFGPHSNQLRMKEYAVTREDIREALGDFEQHYATASRLDDLVEIGNPLIIGSMPRGPDQHNQCSVLCGRTVTGRLLHLVVTADTYHPFLVTLWCPEDEHNRTYWMPGCLGPTKQGVRVNREGTIWALDPNK
jgi:hypothetical protein